jgi:putative IMPACT (imprinted ancient) family translation regulator
MLAVLLGSGVGDIVVVVTRYFGGTKLGTGGLVKAYAGAVKSALAALPLREKVRLQSLQLNGGYEWISALDRLLPSYEAQVTERTFDASVTWHMTVPEEQLDALVAAIVELSHGKIRITGQGPGTHLDGTIADGW